MELITLKLNNFLNNNFRKKINSILGNYIKNYISPHIFIEIKWLIDFRKDPKSDFASHSSYIFSGLFCMVKNPQCCAEHLVHSPKL